MPSLVPLDNTIGAIMIGLVVSAMIYGITWLQVYLYYTQHSSKDGWFLKILVAIVMILDSSHVVFVLISLYHYTITNFGDYIALQKNTWSYDWHAFVGGLLSIIVQMFFAHRVYRFSGNKMIIPICIGLLCLGKLVCTIGFIIIGFTATLISESDKLLPWIIPALALSIVCDSLIAVCMIYYLQRCRTGFSKTNRAINLLITYALNTCLLACVFNSACMAFYLKDTSSMLYDVFYYILVRLYSCSLMSTLNSRDVVRKELEGATLEGIYTMSRMAAASQNQSTHETHPAHDAMVEKPRLGGDPLIYPASGMGKDSATTVTNPA